MALPQVTAGLAPQKRFIGQFQGIAPSVTTTQTTVLQVTTAWNYVE